MNTTYNIDIPELDPHNATEVLQLVYVQLLALYETYSYLGDAKYGIDGSN